MAYIEKGAADRPFGSGVLVSPGAYGGYATDNPVDPRPASAIAGVHSALDQAQQLSEYVRSVVWRFCGQNELAQGTQEKSPPSNGVFDELERHTDATLREISSAFAAIRRLESQLP
jgi:hypothetical protein